MDFAKIKNAVKEVRFEEVRLDNDEAFEAVIASVDLAKLTAQLTSFFGCAVFPSKHKLSKKMNQAIKAFGGIIPGQTLYSFSNERDTIFAILWPWQDNLHITFKLVRRLCSAS
jgi:hypothetical protein